MMLFVGALCSLPILLVICFYKLGQKIIYDLSKIDEINGEMRRIDKEEIRDDLRELRVQLYHIEAMMIKVPKEHKETDKRRSNCKPRTEAQKKASSEKRKQWWEKKRREAQTAPSDVINQTAASSD